MRTKKTRVLELNFERTWRGGERQTMYNAEGFRNAGLHVEILCRKGFPLEQKARDAGMKARSFKNIFGVIFFLMLHGHRYDIFHVQTSHILTYVVLTRAFHRGKIVYTRRIDFVPKGRLTLLKYKLCTHVVAISSAIQQIVTNFGVKNVTLISSVVEPKPLNKKRAEDLLKDLNLSPDTRIIATTAALVQHKDPLNMVEAIRHCAESHKDFVFLHFGNGNMMEEVEARVVDYGLQDQYKLMGFYKDVEDFFSVMQGFTMSSEEEGLGSSVLDAFIYKVPVASTNAGGLKDLVGDGRAYMCESKNGQALGNAIDKILRNQAESDKKVEQAYDYAYTQHNNEYITAQYLDLLGITAINVPADKPATIMGMPVLNHWQ
ncbi:glycosyltransferase family 4 protein [Chitinophaga sp. Cy-1792]|uniref:glycosyltransferase family 4 protein n=1 Tax=Chitinophaga sp. Cy-1792 TaxID=2608339 RepID=UPI00141E6DDB|nr:glycosyltransferase family 4 protein [Chitinophaga sp. Cy-1792]NIG55491.1 glycosyltransferase family 4 protein [Chitinophaga sp. Cy-1792]